MRLCVMVGGQEGVTWDDWVALARATEELGFEALFRSDHYAHVIGEQELGSLDAWTTLAAVAAMTERIRLGTLVSPATFRHPSVLAKSALTVDRISGGRVRRAARDRQPVAASRAVLVRRRALPPGGREPAAEAGAAAPADHRRRERTAAQRGAREGRDPLTLSVMTTLIRSPGEAVQRLAELADAGVERVMVQHLEHRDLDILEVIARQVLPVVADRNLRG